MIHEPRGRPPTDIASLPTCNILVIIHHTTIAIPTWEDAERRKGFSRRAPEPRYEVMPYSANPDPPAGGQGATGFGLPTSRDFVSGPRLALTLFWKLDPGNPGQA